MPWWHDSQQLASGEPGPIHGVAAEAKDAGLLPGDIVVAINDVAVAGFEMRSVYEFGFKLPPGEDVAWTIERYGARLTLHANSPGHPQPALYLLGDDSGP